MKRWVQLRYEHATGGFLLCRGDRETLREIMGGAWPEWWAELSGDWLVEKRDLGAVIARLLRDGAAITFDPWEEPPL